VIEIFKRQILETRQELKDYKEEQQGDRDEMLHTIR
jgi:hypothetical protein